MSDMTITFYSLNKVGFFERGTGSHLFADADSALRELKAWAANKDVSMTELSAPRLALTATLPVYIFGVESAGSDWLLATWNTTPSYGGKVSSLARDSVVGASPTVHDNPIATNSIPGFPTYFWFIPEHNVFATLKFEMPITAATPMTGYLRQFLSTESGYVVKGADGKIVGYRDLRCTNKPSKAYAKVDASVRAKPGEVARLTRDRELIHTVIRDSSLTQSVTRDKTIFQKLSQVVRDSLTPAAFTQDSKVSIEMKYTPTAAELKQMIDTEQQAVRNSEYDDLGFKLTGTNDIVWINKVTCRVRTSINIRVPPNGVVPVLELANLVTSRRAEFLKGL